MKYLKEIGYKNIEDVIFFDIETTSCVEDLEYKSDLYNSYKYKIRKEAEDFTINDVKEHFKKNAPLYAPFARIVCISVGYIKDEQVRKKSYTGEEQDILNNFFDDLDLFINRSGKKFLSGFNILVYDIPVISFRAMVHDIKVNPWFDVAGQKPWNLKHIIDLSDLTRGTAFASLSLLNVTVAFGFPSPKEDIDGSEVSSAFYRGEIDRIASYCERDVEATVNIFRKIAKTN